MVDSHISSPEHIYWQSSVLSDHSLGSVEGKLFRFGITQRQSSSKDDFGKTCDGVLAADFFRFTAHHDACAPDGLRACATKGIMALKHLHTAIYGTKEDAVFFSLLDDVFGTDQMYGKQLLGEQLWYQLLYYATLLSQHSDC